MTSQSKALVFAACIAMFPLCGFGPDSGARVSEDFIVTAVPAYQLLAALHGQERFPRGAQLLLVHQGKSEPLVSGFAVAADANVSFDGTHVLFAGKKSETDPWQIWELALTDRSVRQETSGSEDAIRPLYLPDGRFVYAQRTPAGFQLRAAPRGESEGAEKVHAEVDVTAIQLTHADASAIPVDVLADGRILFESGFPLGSGATPELYLVYSDGSGVESYRCDHGTARWGGTQLASGDVVFTHGTSLARFTSPLAHEERIAAPPAEYAGAIAETKSGDWLVSAKSTSEKNYAIKLWKPGASALQTVLAESGNELVEPVLVAPHSTPKRHPSGLHPWDYANLLALDARISRDGALKGVPATVRVEAKDGTGYPVALGIAPIEPDGSYFVKVPGDRPIRFAVLDAKGSILRQERGWFWARGGEQRICVGCHAGPERASENRVPAVLLRTTTPVDLTGPAVANQTASAGGR